MSCPGIFDGIVQQKDLNTNDSFYMLDPEKVSVTIPAGAVLELHVPVKLTLQGCVPNGTDFDISNLTEARAQPGVNFTAGSIRQAVVRGKVTGEECPKLNVRVTKVQDKYTVASGEEREYTVRFENLSAIEAPISLRDVFATTSPVGSKYSAQWAVRCGSGTKNMSCPSIVNDVNKDVEINSGYSVQLFPQADIPVTLPVGAVLELVIPVKVDVRTCVSGSTSIPVTNRVSAAPQNGYSFTNENPSSQQVGGNIYCNDVSTNTRVSPVEANPGEEVSVISRVSNAAGRAYKIPVQITIPKNVFVYDPVQQNKPPWLCRRGSGADISVDSGVGITCPTVSTVSSTGEAYIFNLEFGEETLGRVWGGTTGGLAAGEWLDIYIPGEMKFASTSGVISSDVKTETPPSVLGDVNPVNDSKTTLSITTYLAGMRVVQKLNGPAPVDVVIPGQLFCKEQGDPALGFAVAGGEFEVAVRKGQESGETILPKRVFAYDECWVRMTRPSAPAGYRWGISDDDPKKSEPEWAPTANGGWAVPVDPTGSVPVGAHDAESNAFVFNGDPIPPGSKATFDLNVNNVSVNQSTQDLMVEQRIAPLTTNVTTTFALALQQSLGFAFDKTDQQGQPINANLYVQMALTRALDGTTVWDSGPLSLDTGRSASVGTMSSKFFVDTDDLPEGEYLLSESVAPAGFIGSTDHWHIRIDRSSPVTVKLLGTSSDSEPELDTTSAKNLSTGFEPVDFIEVRNTAEDPGMTPTLPLTGGAGWFAYTPLAFLLFIVSVGLVRRKGSIRSLQT